MNRLALQSSLNDLVLKAGGTTRDYELYHNISDKLAPVMAKRFISSISRIQLALSVSALEQALSSDEPEESALSVIDWATVFSGMQEMLTPQYASIVAEAGKLTQELLNRQFGVTLSFNSRNPFAQAVIERDVGNLIVEVAEQAKSMVRGIISDATQYGGHPYETAQQIRDYIGLTERQYAAVRKRAQALITEGKSVEEAYAQGKHYADYLVGRRAEVIARTETIRAANGGQQAAWESAVDQGHLEGMKKKWIITPDDRLCEVCNGLGRRPPIEIDELFGGEVLHPPLHPNCRCAMGLVRGEKE